MLNLKLQVKPKVSNVLSVQLSFILEKNNISFWKLINEIEANPIFLKLLYYKKEKPLVIIPRKHIPILNLQFSSNLYDIEEQISIEPILLKKLRKIGLEKFMKLFLSRNNYTNLELMSLVNLTFEEIKKIRKILLDIHIYDTFTPLDTSNQYINNFYKYEVVARVNISKKQLIVEFLNYKQRYKINYDIVDKLLNKSEMKDFLVLAQEMNKVNMRLNLINKITDEIVKCQKKYFFSRDKNDLEILQQNKLAGKLNIHPSIIARTIKNKTIISPWGKEELIRNFLISLRNKNREKSIKRLKELLKNLSLRDSTDENLKKILFQRYSIDISRRTVNLLRNKLKI